jgi:hypothetical protein
MNKGSQSKGARHTKVGTGNRSFGRTICLVYFTVCLHPWCRIYLAAARLLRRHLVGGDRFVVAAFVG